MWSTKTPGPNGMNPLIQRTVRWIQGPVETDLARVALVDNLDRQFRIGRTTVHGFAGRIDSKSGVLGDELRCLVARLTPFTGLQL